MYSLKDLTNVLESKNIEYTIVNESEAIVQVVNVFLANRIVECSVCLRLKGTKARIHSRYDYDNLMQVSMSDLLACEKLTNELLYKLVHKNDDIF